MYGKLLSFLTGGQSDFPWPLARTWHGIDVGLGLEAIILVACLAAGFCLCETFLTSSRRKGIAAFLGALLFATAAYAASSTLGNLSAGGAISAGDLFYDVQSVGSGGVKVTGTQLKTFFVPTTPVTPSGTLTLGDVLCGNGTTVATDCTNVTGGVSLDSNGHTGFALDPNGHSSFTPGAVSLGGTVSTTTTGIIGTMTATGTCSAGACPINQLAITSDNVASSGADVRGWYFPYTFGGAAATGNRIGLVSSTLMNQTTGNVAGTQSYGAAALYGTASANDGGSNLTTLSAGQVETVNVIATLQNGATFWRNLQGMEIDTSVQTGASVKNKMALELTQLATDKVAGANLDAALVIANQAGGAVGWANAISIGGGDGVFPMAAGGTIFATIAGTTTNGIDQSATTFTGSAFKSSGHQVDGNGNIAVSSITGINASAGALQLSGIVTAPTLGANGEGVVYLSSTGGLNLQAQGSTNDFTFVNHNGTAIATIASSGLLTIGPPISGTADLIVNNDNTNCSATWQMRIQGSSNNNKQLVFGYDTTNNVGCIQANFVGTSLEPLQLQPLGGVLAIGGSITEKVRSVGTTTVTASATTDYFFCLDPTSNAINVALPASPATGLTYLIKDCTGKAATHTITITPNTGNIDGSGTTTLTTNFQSIAITYTGAQWSIN